MNFKIFFLFALVCLAFVVNINADLSSEYGDYSSEETTTKAPGPRVVAPAATTPKPIVRGAAPKPAKKV
jgi:hypothetical protein